MGYLTRKFLRTIILLPQWLELEIRQHQCLFLMIGHKVARLSNLAVLNSWSIAKQSQTIKGEYLYRLDEDRKWLVKLTHSFCYISVEWDKKMAKIWVASSRHYWKNLLRLLILYNFTNTLVKSKPKTRPKLQIKLRKWDQIFLSTWKRMAL